MISGWNAQVNSWLYMYFFRVVVDGEGSQTVFNGPESMTDMKFTRINNYVSGRLIHQSLSSKNKTLEIY